MNCIIIEDEDMAVERLEDQLGQTGHDVKVIARIDSVKQAVSWLQENHADLIFLDVQLGDGLAFEIFDHVQVRTPVIFTTSYDQYMTRAFEVNSLSYLLKPAKVESLKLAIDKYHFLEKQGAAINEKILPFHNQHQKRFLVRSGSLSQPIFADDIAYFYVQNKRFLFINTKNKQQFLYDSTLEILEQRLDPERFFRINRQFIINIDIVRQLQAFDNKGRIKLETEPANKEEMIVSISKALEFKNWLDR